MKYEIKKFQFQGNVMFLCVLYNYDPVNALNCFIWWKLASLGGSGWKEYLSQEKGT